MNRPITKQEEINSLIVTIQYHQGFLKLVEGDLKQTAITVQNIAKYKAQLAALQP